MTDPQTDCRAQDAALDAAVVRMTGPGGPFPLGTIDRHGATVPYVTAVPSTLPGFYAAFCALYAERTFLVDGDERLTFAQALDAARMVAQGLIARHGVGPGDRVALAARNGTAWVLAYMGITLAGGVAVLCNAFCGAAELVPAIEDTGCTLVLADGPRHTGLLNHGWSAEGTPRLLPIDDGTWAAALAAVLPADPVATVDLPDLAPTDPATILFTSGSTGRSKGALSDHMGKVQGALSYGGASLCIADMLTQAGRPPSDTPVTLMNVPLFHVTGEVAVFLHSFVIGRTLVMMPKWDALRALELIEAEKVTYFVGVPLMGHEIASHPDRGRFDLSTLTDLAAGGAPRPVDQIATIRDNLVGTHPLLGYGLTETNAVGALNFRASYLAKPTSTGRATKPLVEIAIVDAAGETLPTGQTGEIAIRSVANIVGYWNRPEDTAALFTPGGYARTGDMGYLDEDGYVFIVDRLKDIIIRGGENIAAFEVEAALYGHPMVAECAVIGISHARYGEVPAAIIYARADVVADEDELRAFLRARLAPFKLPERIWWVDAPLPRLGTQKIDKPGLRKIYGAGEGV
ncbi:class I adenylate-forming enzyme family protein [Sphingobium subterraneum]|uniref:Acyl-CoA synthetase (AMP-forming)/AMP-acid ligase II n=1 Tax=Sphingobium subterraneum TaxID=627688 RepID=A0A841J1W7_9SPHN|nr:class I adenylate-forming enzyme family protein [Sphingobium subterraneum]MBB6124650.1 acyl-CoA synthetase (AMP-forming)/AMP-acid ligase II [Sphingobium subterraneum]